jgi:O-methyltransferase
VSWRAPTIVRAPSCAQVSVTCAVVIGQATAPQSLAGRHVVTIGLLGVGRRSQVGNFLKSTLVRVAQSVLPTRFQNKLRHLQRRMEPNYEVKDRREFMRRAFLALRYNGISGDYAEFGCWSGSTFALAYAESRKAQPRPKLWAFDSFQGLPAPEGEKDKHALWTEGDMSMSLDLFRKTCRSNGVPDSAYHVVPGFYEDTIGASADTTALPQDIALAYIDCDLYSSTKTVMAFLGSRLKHGMIVALDDYYCYSATGISGERLACLDF